MIGQRRAFTLLELLVVLGIIGILLALLLPAVQKVREAAARMRCLSNLKQLGLGLHQYHDTFRVFPKGSISNSTTERYPRLSWLAHILPFVEQNALWAEIDQNYRRDRNPFSSVHRTHGHVVKLFLCPTDYRLDNGHTFPQFRNETYAFTSYLGNSGTSVRTHDGVLYFNSAVGIPHIADGASQTLLVGERPPSEDLRLGWWYCGVGQDGVRNGGFDYHMGAANVLPPASSYAYACGPGPFRFQAGELWHPCAAFHHWSLHPGGANFLFADGSARLLSYSAAEVLPRLATRAGGEIASVPE